jgi:hypothetical protein
MTRDEYDQVLATEPATPNQIGAVHREFGRLGVDDRAERLAISAELLGLDEVGSTTDLVMGQAGRLVGILQQVDNRADLPAVPAGDISHDQPGGGEDLADEPGGDVSLVDAIKAVILTFLIAQDTRRKRENRSTGRSGVRKSDRAQEGYLPGFRSAHIRADIGTTACRGVGLLPSAKVSWASCSLAARGRGHKKGGRGIPRHISRPRA